MGAEIFRKFITIFNHDTDATYYSASYGPFPFSRAILVEVREIINSQIIGLLDKAEGWNRNHLLLNN